MKRSAAFFLAVLLVLALSGCSLEQCLTDRHIDLSNAARVKIFVNDTEQTVELSGGTDVKHIADNLGTLTFEKAEISESPVAEYTLTWFDSSDKIICDMTLPYGEFLLGYDGIYYTVTGGSIDRDFLAETVEMSVSSGPKPAPTNNKTNSSGLVGIGRTSSTDAWLDSLGIKLTASDITPTGMTLVCTQQDGSHTGKLFSGSPYALEVFKNGDWEAVETTEEGAEICWTMEAWEIPFNQTTKRTVDWTFLYGELTVGSYRLVKSIMDFRGTADFDNKNYYAGFDIIAIGDETTVSYEYNGFGLSLPYVSGWEYTVEEYAEGCMSYGIDYRPSGEDGWIRFHYWESFGVCGTGLESKRYGTGNMGTYDNHDVWNFISFPASKGYYVAMTENVGSWWKMHGDVAMEILDRVELYGATE